MRNLAYTWRTEDERDLNNIGKGSFQSSLNHNAVDNAKVWKVGLGWHV
jgi:hypothetical protein